MSDYDDVFDEHELYQTNEEKYERVNRFLKQKNIYTWWNYQFPQRLDKKITIATRVYEHPNPPEYFDFLIEAVKDQTQNMITWLITQEAYEMCRPVHTKSDQLLTELEALNLRVTQLL